MAGISHIALVGNPNSGKTSVFNQLTGLNQHVGNYPGVTVDKKEGRFQLPSGSSIELLDLPGIYSLFPKSEDEQVVYRLLHDRNGQNQDLCIVVVDATNLERNLLLLTQVLDLGLPVILALNMSDRLAGEGIEIQEKQLSEMLGGVPVVKLDAQRGEGIDDLKTAIEQYEMTEVTPFLEGSIIRQNNLSQLTEESLLVEDTNLRYKRIRQILNFCVKRNVVSASRKNTTRRIDWLVTHPILGYLFFLGILFIIFQVIFEFANIPMDLIDNVFLVFSQQVASLLPPGIFTDLLAEGIIPGIGGVVIFVPQIALLFLFISILEESGYMSRVVFIMDRLMRPFGLSGKSVVPLISGMACAIPAVMASRTIDQWKDRLVTIMVVPLTSCSARLPVYALLIALVVPDQTVAGFMNLQGLVLMGMYLLGFTAALLVAVFFKFIIKSQQRSFLIMEMPVYKWPRMSNVGLIIWEKTRVFVWEAGKVIMAISIILWVLASYGPPGRMEQAVSEIPVVVDGSEEDQRSYDQQVSAVELENSWIGILGKQIEPVIRPLGYNWQIGISLITSFAAREVFVGSMATIYSVGEDFEESDTLLERMRAEIDLDTGQPVYNIASGISLMVFYAFAMQCMSTIAIVRRETKSWKWPLIQMAYMTVLAYLGAFIAYNIFS